MNTQHFFFSLLISMILLTGCRQHSPEQLPKFKEKFRNQIASFEGQKDKADKRVEEGVETLSGLQQAIANAKDIDKEFNAVYGKWERVNKQVEDLNKEYEKLKTDAENLFGAMEIQTASLNDAGTRQELSKALQTTRKDYEGTLAKTSVAIEKLRSLHADAVDIIKALEVAVALGQISQINDGLKNIESKVDDIMADLNSTIAESKELYEQRIGTF